MVPRKEDQEERRTLQPYPLGVLSTLCPLLCRISEYRELFQDDYRQHRNIRQPQRRVRSRPRREETKGLHDGLYRRRALRYTRCSPHNEPRLPPRPHRYSLCRRSEPFVEQDHRQGRDTECRNEEQVHPFPETRWHRCYLAHTVDRPSRYSDPLWRKRKHQQKP